MQTEQLIDATTTVATTPKAIRPTPRRSAKSQYPMPLAPRSLTAWAQRLARDPNGSNLVNFPFALTVSLISTAGIAAVGWGATLACEWLAGCGFLLMLVGSVFYGLSHE